MHAGLKTILDKLESGAWVRIAGLGDSLTYGWDVKRGFFDRFLDGLRARYPDARIEAANAGVPGDTAAGGLRRLPSVLALKPDLVVIQFGLNDCFAGVPPRAYSASTSALVQGVNEARATPLLVTSCPVENREDDRRVGLFYDALKRVATQHDAPLAELDRYWLENLDPDAGQVLYTFDGVHPNDHGHDLLAEGLLALFES